VLNKVTVIVPLKELINVEEEEKKLLKEQARLISEVERSKKMLGNPNFVSKAPAAKIQAEEEKQQKYLEQLAEVEKLLENLKRL
jgi:valyl-tRNA synthetase